LGHKVHESLILQRQNIIALISLRQTSGANQAFCGFYLFSNKVS
jgi:hypothetical protein